MSSDEIGVYGTKEVVEQIFDEKHYKLKKRAVTDEKGNVIATWIDGVEERTEHKFRGKHIERITKKKQLAELHVWVSSYKYETFDSRTKQYVYKYKPVIGITVKSLDGKARIILHMDDLRRLINALRRAEYLGKKIEKKKDSIVKV